MTNFQWVIPQDSMLTELAIDNMTNVVVQVNAYRQVSDETTSTQIPVCVGLTPPKDGFIPYDQLTKEIVEGWLNENSDVTTLDIELSFQLENIKNPKVQVLPNPF